MPAAFASPNAIFAKAAWKASKKIGPHGYQELAPYCSYVERMIGVTGSRENLEILPDGEFLPPLKFRCSRDTSSSVRAEKLGIRVIPTRKALNTVPYDGRPACHYCGHCMEACDVGAIFTVPDSMLPKARKTGNFHSLQNRSWRANYCWSTQGRIRAISYGLIPSHAKKAKCAPAFSQSVAEP